jgi:hypothetical protein
MSETLIHNNIISMVHELSKLMPSEISEIITIVYGIGNETILISKPAGDKILEMLRDYIDQYDDFEHKISEYEGNDNLEEKQHYLSEMAAIDNEFKINVCNQVSNILASYQIL